MFFYFYFYLLIDFNGVGKVKAMVEAVML